MRFFQLVDEEERNDQASPVVGLRGQVRGLTVLSASERL